MGILEKAKKILDEGKVRKEIETDKRSHYSVIGDTENHSIIFNEFGKKWSCDCRFSVLQNKDCSHITACKLLDEKQKQT